MQNILTILKKGKTIVQYDRLDKVFFPSAVRNFQQMTDSQQTRNKLFII